MGFKYIIEHMEEDDEASKAIPRWVELEYSHMRTLAGPNAHIHFTHLSVGSCKWLEKKFEGGDSCNDDATVAKVSVHREGVMELLESKGGQLSTSIERVCLLDPKAEEELKPEDGDGRFDCFLFGGILGDDPPRDRTAELRVFKFPSRRLGPVQMTTDTALGVTKLVVEDGVGLEDIKYADFPSIRFNAKESVEMPFRYIAVGGDGREPLLPPGMKQLLKQDLDRSFDF
ncbi:hypothetical protein AX17_006329 [Amanita inopinata Kibby_2008]|nr:hypothetical protein AX17_006329 [Amanita inopinata Kibby_2008]